MKYYSEKTKFFYDTEEEVIEAEKIFDAQEAEKNKEKEAKKAKAMEIENLYKEYLDYCDQANKVAKEKKQKYLEKRNEFIKEYGSYHVTYSKVDGKEEITVSDLLEEALRHFPSMWRL